MATRIYTRTGDTGETGLFGGTRVGKDDRRVEAYGTVDELNCVLGLARAAGDDPDLSRILTRLQNDLFTLGADLATPDMPDDGRGRVAIPRVSAEAITALETEIDRLEAELRPLTRFILPGGTPLAAHLHHARAVCRRTERRCSTLLRAERVNPEILRYLNRLSDLLFVMARAANARAGAADVEWEQG